jgi:hypothetical protein
MWAWLFTAAGKRVLFATAFAALLGGGFLALRAHYIALGKTESASAAIDAGAKQLAAQQKQFQARYAALESQRAAGAAQSEALLAATTKLASQVAALESQRTQASAQIAALPAASVVPDLHRKLGVAPESAAPALAPAELRAADQIVTQFPQVQAENRDLAAGNQSLAARAASLTSEITATAGERDLAFGWGDALFAQYRACYNSFPRHRGIFARICHVATFGLGCKPKQLALPAPDALARLRPAKPSASPNAKPPAAPHDSSSPQKSPPKASSRTKVPPAGN